MASPDFTIEEQLMGSRTKLIIKGRIDMTSADALDHYIKKAYGRTATTVVLDMAQVPYMNSTGIRVLLMWYKKAKAQSHEFYVINPSESIKNVLGMTALEQLLLR